jgi:acyl-CoA synthetase (AMP-forming)/AMP-acid ligase II
MQMPNTVEQFLVYLACARLGVIVSPVPVQYRENELGQIFERTRAVAALTFSRIGRAEAPFEGAAMFARLRAGHPHLRSVIAFGPDLPPGCIDVAPRMTRPTSAPDRATLEQAASAAQVCADDVFTICWTSGTEAAPKGVPRSHNEWLVIAPSIIESAELRPGVRLLNPFPLVNMAGVSTALATWLMLGGVVIQHHPFSLNVFLDQIRDERIDYTVAPPAVLNALLQDLSLLEGIDFKRLTRIGSGSAPLSDWMVQGFAERYGVQIVNYFGSNEGAALSGCPRDIPDPRLRARFFPRAGVDGFQWSVSTSAKIRTRLVNLETGETITEAGVPGELRFTGPTIFTGYYDAPELTARAFDDQGFYKTGDLFEIAGDQGQYYRFVGRSKDLIIRGGMNISAEEIENLLAGCPGIREAAVVGVPDRIMGERVCVCVAAAEGQPAPTLPTIVAHLRDERRIAAYKLPEYVLEMDALPRNPVGKVLKSVLRALVRDRFVPADA